MTKPKQLDLFAQADPAGRKPKLLDGLAVRDVQCKAVLNGRGDAGYSFNCYTGCSNGCAYCYARYMQKFHPHAEPWGQFVDVKVNAPDVLARQLRRLKPGSVFTCSACDGWQSVERRYQLTRRCCQLLLEAGFSLAILTKNELVLRDLDVFAGREVSLGVTITTADPATARLWEPGASPVPARVNILKQARMAGLQTTIMFGPLLPGISDTTEGLRALFALAAEANVGRIWTDALNPRPRVWPSVQALLRAHRPDLPAYYRRILFDAAARDRYLAELRQRVEQAAAECGLADRLQ